VFNPQPAEDLIAAQSQFPKTAVNIQIANAAQVLAERPRPHYKGYGIPFKLVKRSNDNFSKTVRHKSYPYHGSENPYRQECK
jgi:hypothetical protein